MANPLWVDTWSEADLETLVSKREIGRKTYKEIAAEMNRPWQTVYDRYVKIVKARPPAESAVEAPSVVPLLREIPPLHKELGIETYVHMQAVLHTPVGGWPKREQVNAHWYRMPITLAKVI